jgi:hypothetical protein
MQQTTIPLPASDERNIRPTASTTQFWMDKYTSFLTQWLVEVGGMEKAPPEKVGRLAFLLYGNDCWLEIHPQSQTGAYHVVCKGKNAEELAAWITHYARGERGPLVATEAEPVTSETVPPVRRTRKKIESAA